MELEEAQDKARLVVKDIQEWFVQRGLCAANDVPEDIGVYGDDGDYPGHEIIRYDGMYIEIFNGYYDGDLSDECGQPVDNLHRIMDKHFNSEWDMENHFCINVHNVTSQNWEDG